VVTRWCRPTELPTPAAASIGMGNRVCVCLFVDMIIPEPFEYHREIFTAARYGQKLGRVVKRLHSDALRARS